MVIFLYTEVLKKLYKDTSFEDHNHTNKHLLNY